MKANSDELQSFVSVVDSGSISAAAEQMGLTASAVSRTLSRLEHKLGTTLLNRTTRRMELTEEGRYFLDQARQILQQMEALEERLALRRQSPAGRLRINAASPFMLHAVVPHIGEFRRLYPNIQLELNTNDLIIDLLEQRTDVAIRIGALSDSTLHARPLGASRLHILASPEYLARHGMPTSIEGLRGHTLLGFTQPEHLNRWPVVHADGDRLEIQPDISASSGETLRQLHDRPRYPGRAPGAAVRRTDERIPATDPRRLLPQLATGAAHPVLPRLHPAAPGRLRPTVNESLDFSPYLERWALQPDGEPFATHSSRLLPVRHRGAAAMLKISSAEEERFGHVLLNWWDGQGAARVLAYDHQALLMERATGGRSLLEMVKRGDDDEATRILCQAIERIHAPRPGPLPELTPLERWFDSLYAAERRYGGLYVDCANAARYLLETAREQRPLHGDIHHGNVLDFGERGWQVIDPKRLYGERGYDYANLFTNPDAKTAQAPGRFERQLEIVVAASGLQRRRLLLWILAWTGLSAAWFDEDGSREETDAELAIARLALASLSREG